MPQPLIPQLLSCTELLVTATIFTKPSPEIVPQLRLHRRQHPWTVESSPSSRSPCRYHSFAVRSVTQPPTIYIYIYIYSRVNYHRPTLPLYQHPSAYRRTGPFQIRKPTFRFMMVGEEEHWRRRSLETKRL